MILGLMQQKTKTDLEKVTANLVAVSNALKKAIQTRRWVSLTFDGQEYHINANEHLLRAIHAFRDTVLIEPAEVGGTQGVHEIINESAVIDAFDTARFAPNAIIYVGAMEDYDEYPDLLVTRSKEAIGKIKNALQL